MDKDDFSSNTAKGNREQHACRSIYCFIPTMGAGGAERVMALLANHLVDCGYEVTLVTLDDPSAPSFFHLDQRVMRVGLGLHRDHRVVRLLSLPHMVWSLRRLVVSSWPDCLLSFLDVMNMPLLIATLGLEIPVIVSERSDPRFHRFRSVRDRLRALTYRRAATIVVQTTQVRDRFPPELQGRIAVIPNAVPPPRATARPDRPNPQGRFRIVGVGRLHRAKGFDRLLRAFANLADRFPDWDLVIFGEGPEENRLRDLTGRLNLGDKVRFAGLTEEVGRELSQAHLFALPSRYEGYPNALAEAVSHGLPAIAFTGVSGTSALISDGKTGLLVVPGPDDVACLSEALRRLMSDSDLRAHMGQAARAKRESHRPEHVFAQWRALFDHPRATA